MSSASVVCLIHPENLASVRVAEKCGFSRRCETTPNRALVIWYGSAPISMSRATAPAAVAAWKVLISRWPDRAA